MTLLRECSAIRYVCVLLLPFCVCSDRSECLSDSQQDCAKCLCGQRWSLLLAQLRCIADVEALQWKMLCCVVVEVWKFAL